MLERTVKTDTVGIAGRRYVVRFSEVTTARGTSRFSVELVLGPEDVVILDGDSLVGLEARLTSLVAVSVYSRILAGTNRRRGLKPHRGDRLL